MSTVKAAGDESDAVLDETAQSQPDTPYGRSKLAAEQLVLEGGYVPEPVVLRPAMVYGPTRKGNLPRMIEAIRKGRFPPLPKASGRRSMVHVADVARAALLVSWSPRAVGQCYILTDGRRYSTREIYEWICVALGRPVPRWGVPRGALQVAAAFGDLIGRVRGKRFMFDSGTLHKVIGSALYSSEKIERELGFRAQHDLRTALPAIVAALQTRT
jgi:nucleoside-diphosphate-sugar epimerase